MAIAKISTAEAIGDIRRFPLENVWRQKWLMMKTETFETIIYHSLCAAYEHWLETDYGNRTLLSIVSAPTEFERRG